MPIYEYKCEDCNKITEIWHGVNESPKTSCPYCGGRLHKIISQTSFILKGSGWYATDYRNSSGGNSNSHRKRGKRSDKSESDRGSKETGAAD